MKLSLAILMVHVASFTGTLGAEPPPTAHGPRPLETSCVACHAQLDGALLEPTRHTDDIHFQKGLSCNDCHGGDPSAGGDGDPSAAHDSSKGFAGKPPRARIPNFCGKCHADAAYMKRFNPHARVDQLSEYRTSVHGRQNAAGDVRTAVCIDCHGVHGIRAVSDPRSSVHPANVAETCGHCHSNADLMGHYFLPTNQYDEYRTSVHARALYDKGDTSAPTCNDCHGSHGAVPPGVENVANVCGTCHGREATLFRETESKRNLDLTACIQCMVCHSNHAVLQPSDEMVGLGPKSTCTGCHAEGDAGYAAAAKMSEGLQRLTARLEEARGLLGRAERAGMEVSADRFALQSAQDKLVEAKVLVHSFDLERFVAAAGEGTRTADTGVVAGRRAFEELRFRRIGLALSLVVILLVILALALKIRDIEQRTPS